MKGYLWTEKAEARAKELGLEERKAGTPARFGLSEPGDIPVSIAVPWVQKGYIVRSDDKGAN